MPTFTFQVQAVAEIDITAASASEAAAQIYGALPPGTDFAFATPTGNLSVEFHIVVDKLTKVDGIPAGIIT